MVVKLAVFFSVVAAAAAVIVPSGQVALGNKLVYADQDTPAQYEYEYSVQDQQTGDIKSSKENRNGDNVSGYYTVVQPDGLQRIVEYTSSAEHGFNAVVRYEGNRIQAPTKILAQAPVAYAAAPVAKVAYAPAPAQVAYAQPVAKYAYAQAPAQVTYAAPVAKVAYAPAQVTKVAYAQAPAQVTYAQAPAQVTYAQAPAHVAYAPAPAQVAYAHAPVYAQAPAGVTYAQPIAKVAYSPAASVGHVTYSSPAASYHH